MLFRSEAALLNTQWVSHTNTVLRELERLHLRVAEAESARRGYLLTQNPAYLALYYDSESAVAGDLEQLQRLVQDNPEQRENLRLLEPALQAKLAHMRELDVVRSLRPETVESGKIKMDRLRSQLSRMETAEERLLEARQALSEQSRRKEIGRAHV